MIGTEPLAVASGSIPGEAPFPLISHNPLATASGSVPSSHQALIGDSFPSMAIVQSEAEFPGTVMLVFFAVSFMSSRLWVRRGLICALVLLTAHCYLLTA